jgi:ABC-type nitrate/sulfonate/bicarbonate transport system substrate-binding protein
MSATALTVGFIPLLDCAALVVAGEKGFAADEGIDLRLVRENSWASIRDRLLVGHFDAAHLLGPMTVASTLGIGHVTVPMIAPFALGFGGNAVTFSTPLAEEMRRHGVRPGDGPRAQGEALARVVAQRAASAQPLLTFGMVYPFSCHNYELRYWLAAVGIDPDRDVRLVVVPPPLLVDTMLAGHLDGFCVGEPWNSVAVEAGVGSIAFGTTSIWSRSPEKVLGCRADWAERHPGDLAALLRAVYRASEWCGDEGNHHELARLLAPERWVGAPAEVLERALTGRLALTRSSPPSALPGFFSPFEEQATFPWVSHALWFYSQMVRWGQVAWSPSHVAAVGRAYRPDLYREALAPLGVRAPDVDLRIEGGVAASGQAAPGAFFDGLSFDPSRLEAYVDTLPFSRKASV